MQVVTLLPAATEIVAALGGADRLVGISHECDHPGWVQHLPRVTATPVDVAAPGRVVDAEVRRLTELGGGSAGLEVEAEELVFGLRSRVARLRGSTAPEQAAVLCIEWLDQLYLAGHWVPELVAAAGGKDVGAEPGSHSAKRDWKELKPLHPDHIVVMLCGFGTEQPAHDVESWPPVVC